MKTGVMIAALILAAGWGAARLAAEDAPQADSSDDAVKEFPFDKGPDTIDVSAYPQEQQDNYALFSQKCSKCHTLARPINSPFALPDEWETYVHKMQHKKRSGVDEDSAKRIIDFLVFDSKIRKKDLIAQKTKDKAPGKDVKSSSDTAKSDATKADAPASKP